MKINSIWVDLFSFWHILSNYNIRVYICQIFGGGGTLHAGNVSFFAIYLFARWLLLLVASLTSWTKMGTSGTLLMMGGIGYCQSIQYHFIIVSVTNSWNTSAFVLGFFSWNFQIFRGAYFSTSSEILLICFEIFLLHVLCGSQIILQRECCPSVVMLQMKET